MSWWICFSLIFVYFTSATGTDVCNFIHSEAAGRFKNNRKKKLTFVCIINSLCVVLFMHAFTNESRILSHDAIIYVHSMNEYYLKNASMGLSTAMAQFPPDNLLSIDVSLFVRSPLRRSSPALGSSLKWSDCSGLFTCLAFTQLLPGQLKAYDNIEKSLTATRKAIIHLFPPSTTLSRLSVDLFLSSADNITCVFDLFKVAEWMRTFHECFEWHIENIWRIPMTK